MKIKFDWLDKEVTKVNPVTKEKTTAVQPTPVPSVLLKDDGEWEEGIVTMSQLQLVIHILEKAEFIQLPTTFTDPKTKEVTDIVDSVLITIPDDLGSCVIESTMNKAELYIFIMGVINISGADEYARSVAYSLVETLAMFYNNEIIPKVAGRVAQSVVNVIQGRVPMQKSQGGLIVPK